jgi:hypothetical protein
MIEIRRDMYMEEATGLKRPNFRAISQQLCSLIEELAQFAEAEFSAGAADRRTTPKTPALSDLLEDVRRTHPLV